MFNPMTLEGKRILVTGASSGIGRACAVMSSQLGAEVILVARREEALEETRTMMVCPERHRCIGWDIGQTETIPQLFEELLKGGKLHGLIHAAGVCTASPIGFADMAEAHSVMEINFFAFLAMMKQCSKKRTVFERFSAVAVSSVAADAGYGGVSVYSASKGALSSSVRTLAIEFAPKGYRVNAVCPSNIDTPMWQTNATVINTEEQLKVLLARQPLGLGQPDQVASAVCFLLSDAASFITGANLPVDGGYLAQ
ncbi:MAG: SDR family oxidoreductase [Kiritimatiellia bacterium]